LRRIPQKGILIPVRTAACPPLVLTAAVFFLALHIGKNFVFPYPPFNRLVYDVAEEFRDQPSFARPLGSEGGFRDLGGVLLGMRRLTADIAWISVLQYYGS